MQEPNAMAYAVKLSQEDAEQTIFLPEFEGGDAATLDMEWEGRVFRGMDLAGCLMFGVPVPAELTRSVPKRLVMNTSGSQQGEGESKRFPDFGVGPWGGFHLVSEAFVDIVERLEPAKHQFLPIEETLDADRNAVGKRYFIMNILAKFNAVDVDRSSVRMEEKERTLRGIAAGKKVVLRTMHWIHGKPRVLVFKRSVVNGHHLWTGTTEDIVQTGFSDALFEAVHAAGLSPLQYTRADEI
jgi:hypothetical protein